MAATSSSTVKPFVMVPAGKHVTRWFSRFDKNLGHLDQASKGFQGICVMGRDISTLQGHTLPGFNSFKHPFDIARGVVSSARAVCSAVQLATGRMFLEEDGTLRDVYDIAMDVILAVSRFFNFTGWLHRLKAIDLGKHASWLGTCVMAGYTILGTMDLVTSTKNFFEAVSDPVKIKKAAAALVDSFFQFLAMPWENGLVGFNCSPALNIVGGAICAASTITHFTCQLVADFNSDRTLKIE